MAKSILSFQYLVWPYPLDVGMYDLSFLYLAWAVFLKYGVFWFTFLIPCWAYPWNVGNVWFVSLLCVLALCMMYVCVCVYIYICLFVCGCLWVVMHFLWWTPMVRRAALSWSWVLLTLWCGYALKATVVGIYSYYIVCMIITGCLSRSMLASDIGFPVYVTCINMLDALVSINIPCTNMPTHIVYIGTKLCRCVIACQMQDSTKFSPWKWGTFVAVFLQQKFSEDSALCAIAH